MSQNLLLSYPLGGDKGEVELGGACLEMGAGKSLKKNLKKVTEGRVGIPTQPSTGLLSKPKQDFPLGLTLLSSEMEMVTPGLCAVLGRSEMIPLQGASLTVYVGWTIV